MRLTECLRRELDTDVREQAAYAPTNHRILSLQILMVELSPSTRSIERGGPSSKVSYRIVVMTTVLPY
jgi:hypothetical protein